jgi:hypothetical protein
MRVVVAFALDERVEQLRAEVRKYLRQQGATERPLSSEDRGSGVTAYGGFDRGNAALETSRALRRGIEAIVGPRGLTRLFVSVHPREEIVPIARIRLRRVGAVDQHADCV